MFLVERGSRKVVITMVEIETKFLLTKEKEKEVRRDYSFGDDLYQLTVMFDKNNELYNEDARLRLRRTGGDVTLDYKKPLTRFGVKKEIEYTASLGSFEEMEALLTLLGYFPVSSYEKYRASLTLLGCVVVIDRYPFATYIEVEGDASSVTTVSERLGFNMKDNLTQSCDDLYAEHMRSLGKEPKDHILFRDFT